MYIQYKLLLTFIMYSIMHSATIKYFKILELIHSQIKILKRGQAKVEEGQMLPSSPLKENLALTSDLYMKINYMLIITYTCAHITF